MESEYRVPTIASIGLGPVERRGGAAPGGTVEGHERQPFEPRRFGNRRSIGTAGEA